MDYVCYYCNKTSQKKKELLDHLVMQHRHKRMRMKYKIFSEKTGFQTKDFNLVPTEILKAIETCGIDEAKWEVYVEKRSDHQDADIKGVSLFDFDFELEEHASSLFAKRPKYSAPKGKSSTSTIDKLICLEKAEEFEDKIFDTFLPPLICNMTDDHPKTDLDNDNLSFHDMQDKCDTPLLEQYRPAMTIAVDMGRKATKQTNKTKLFINECNTTDTGFHRG